MTEPSNTVHTPSEPAKAEPRASSGAGMLSPPASKRAGEANALATWRKMVSEASVPWEEPISHQENGVISFQWVHGTRTLTLFDTNNDSYKPDFLALWNWLTQ